MYNRIFMKLCSFSVTFLKKSHLKILFCYDFYISCGVIIIFAHFSYSDDKIVIINVVILFLKTFLQA